MHREQPAPITKIPYLSEIDHLLTNAEKLVQSPTPELVHIIGVKANPTAKGVEIISQTSLGEQLQVLNRSTGNNFIADIPNAQLSLPTGEAYTFRSEKPLAGITEITEDTRPEYKGNQPNNVARNSASLWTTYEIQTGGLKGFGFAGGLFFVGDRQGDLPNTFTLPSYVRTDAAIFYRRDNWQVGLNFKNLFDVYYFESANSENGVFPGAPFTVLGTVSWQF
ncbi:MAG: TonB-dependent receptor [Nostoc sp.]